MCNFIVLHNFSTDSNLVQWQETKRAKFRWSRYHHLLWSLEIHYHVAFSFSSYQHLALLTHPSAIPMLLHQRVAFQSVNFVAGWAPCACVQFPKSSSDLVDSELLLASICYAHLQPTQWFISVGQPSLTMVLPEVLAQSSIVILTCYSLQTMLLTECTANVTFRCNYRHLLCVCYSCVCVVPFTGMILLSAHKGKPDRRMQSLSPHPWSISNGPYTESNPVHTLTSYFFKIHFSIILPARAVP
jgi:hypothetical protein